MIIKELKKTTRSMWAGLVGTVSGKLLWTFGSCLVLYPGRKKTTRRMGDRFFLSR
jgi:hypothetical protein